MKKIAITLCILGGLGIASCAFASIREESMATVPFLRADGHTEEMGKIADYVIYKHSNETAIPYYNQDPYADAATHGLKWYTAIKRWFDPMQDDMLFGRHEIKFSNAWSQNTPPLRDKSLKSKEKSIEPVVAEEVVDDVAAEVQQAVEMEPAASDMDIDSL